MARPFAVFALFWLGLTSLGSSLALRLETVQSGGRPYTVAVVDLRQDRLTLHWRNPTTSGPYRRFSELRERLRKEGQRLLFATNSGIYAPGLRPLGLHVQGGQTQVPLNLARSGGNFALQPNGVFWVRGTRAGVVSTDEYRRGAVAPTHATQSGPLLVRAGKLHPEFSPRGTSFKLRSGVGVCRDGRVRFVVSGVPVNFYTFAVFFRDTLGCPDALYLDGSISAYATERGDTQLADFAGMWAVSR